MILRNSHRSKNYCGVNDCYQKLKAVYFADQEFLILQISIATNRSDYLQNRSLGLHIANAL